MSDSSNKAIETLQYTGRAAQAKLKIVAIWTVSLAPILMILTLWIMGGLQVIGIDVISFIGIDRQYEAYLRILFVAISFVLIPGLVVAAIITKDDVKKIRTTDAPNGGDGGDYEIPVEKWNRADVYLYDKDADRYMGEKTNTSALTYTGNHHEAIAYYEDDNIIIASGIDESPYNLRMHEDMVERLMTTMRDKFRAGAQTDARRKEYANEDAARETNRMIRDFERETLAEGELPNSPVRDHIDETEQEREEGDDERDLRDSDYQIPDRGEDADTGGDGT